MTPFKTIAASSLISFIAMSAFAADAPPPPANSVAAACKQDIHALCKDIQPGEGRVKECMKAHRDQLSPGCKSAIKESRREKSEQAPGAPAASAPPANPPPGR
ncbi:MAG TPA: cysteine rich repeat-containing protein [Steroidobacteraceae bacterium]